jgi:hypothetical protein
MKLPVQRRHLRARFRAPLRPARSTSAPPTTGCRRARDRGPDRGSGRCSRRWARRAAGCACDTASERGRRPAARPARRRHGEHADTRSRRRLQPAAVVAEAISAPAACARRRGDRGRAPRAPDRRC